MVWGCLIRTGSNDFIVIMYSTHGTGDLEEKEFASVFLLYDRFEGLEKWIAGPEFDRIQNPCMTEELAVECIVSIPLLNQNIRLTFRIRCDGNHDSAGIRSNGYHTKNHGLILADEKMERIL